MRLCSRAELRAFARRSLYGRCKPRYSDTDCVLLLFSLYFATQGNSWMQYTALASYLVSHVFLTARRF